MTDTRKRGVAPGRSTEQRLAALRRANEIRSGRARLKKELAAGRLRIEEIVKEPPEVARGATVEELLLAIPKFGPRRVARLLGRCRISPSKTVGGLTERQRAGLLGHFHG